MGVRADSRVINGKTHEQWRQEILDTFLFDPKEYLEADDKREKELNEQMRRLNLALLNLDAIFGLVEATKITYRMAAEASADKFRVALLDGNKKQGVGFEGNIKQFDEFRERLLRGEVQLPPQGNPRTRIPVEQQLRAEQARKGAVAAGLNAATHAQDQEVFRA